MCEIDNITTDDEQWDEVEYGIPSKARMRREKQMLDALESGAGMEDLDE